MSQQDTIDYDNQELDPEPKTVTLNRDQIRALEKKAKGADDAKAEAEAAKAELSIYRAGLTDLTERQIKALLASAEDTSAEGLKSAAADLWPDRFGETSPEAQAKADQLATHDRVANASAGGQVQPKEDYATAVAQAQTQEEVMALAAKHGVPTTWTNQQ